SRTILNTPTVLIIIPALNEAATIQVVLDEIPLDELKVAGYDAKVVVVDNGSSDDTQQLARQKHATVLVEPKRGKGRAMRRAFAELSADYVFMLDADATYPPCHIPQMLQVLLDGHDVVIGSRLSGTRARGAISPVNLVGNYVLTWLASALYGKKISDLCTGYWGFRGNAIKALKLSSEGFNLEAELFSQVARNGFTLGEVPIHYRRRPTPTKLRALRDGMRIVRTLVGRRF
ncbi:MAG: glycosyltransferase, partial [Dehalococcoidia bacterium]|nr:glycosyltransferase [Dehalococcoidia bacterium]